MREVLTVRVTQRGLRGKEDQQHAPCQNRQADEQKDREDGPVDPGKMGTHGDPLSGAA